MPPVQGIVANGFGPVAQAFQRTARPRGGSALSIRIDGETVVDIWQGIADEANGRAWSDATPSVVFSCTKGWLAIMIGALVDDGRLELDAPVVQYWPDFGAQGKTRITVRQILAHRAGLAAPITDVDLDTALDWPKMTSLLAAQAPLWRPGTAHGYHALTYGWLAGEVIRRVSGQTVGQHFSERIAGPLDLDAWIGVPEVHAHRVAKLYPGSSMTDPALSPDVSPADAPWAERSITLGRAFPPQLIAPDGGFDDPQVQRAEVPGAGGIASAHALAAIWSATVVETGGIRLMSDEIVDDMSVVRSEGPPVWSAPEPHPRWGSGFMLHSQRREFLSQRSFGHDGAGGQVGFADPVHRVGFGFVTNLFEISDDERGTEIVQALRSVINA